MHPAGHATIGLVLAGAAVVQEKGGTNHPVAPGWMFQSVPGQVGGMQLDRSAPYRDWLVGFDRETHALLAQMEALPSGGRVWPVAGLAGVRQAFVRLFRDLQISSRLPLAEGVMRLGRFLQTIRSARRHPTGGIPETVLKEAAARLEGEQRGSVETLLAPLGVAYGRLRKAFALYYGMAPAQYRIRIRIDQACRLLAEGRPVQNVAEMLGYPDPFAFSKQFRQVTGLPPKRYQIEWEM